MKNVIMCSALLMLSACGNEPPHSTLDEFLSQQVGQYTSPAYYISVAEGSSPNYPASWGNAVLFYGYPDNLSVCEAALKAIAGQGTLPPEPYSKCIPANNTIAR